MYLLESRHLAIFRACSFWEEQHTAALGEQAATFLKAVYLAALVHAVEPHMP